MNNPNPKLRNALGISALTAFSLVMIGCGGSSSSAPVAVNAAPGSVTISGSNTAVTEHASIYNLSAVDPENDAITFSTTSTGATISGTVLTFLPHVVAPASAPAIISVIATDSKGAASPAKTIAVVVTPNVAPHFSSTPPTAPIVVGQTLTYTPVCEIDPEGDTITITKTSTAGSYTSGGAFTYTPTLADIGPVTVTFSASDAHTGTATQTFTFTVVSNNTAPHIVTSNIPDVHLNHNISLQFTATDDGVGGPALTWALVSPVAGFTMSSTGLLTSTNSTLGARSLTVTVTDAGGLTDTKTYATNFLADGLPNFSTQTYTETVGGVQFFDPSRVRTTIDSRLKFNWLDVEATSAEFFSNSPVNSIKGWRANISATDTEGDTVKYAVKPNSVFRFGVPYIDTTAANYPGVDANSGEILWTPNRGRYTGPGSDISLTSGFSGPLGHDSTGTDVEGDSLANVLDPANWSFTIVAQQYIGSVATSGQFNETTLIIKVEPNDRPYQGPADLIWLDESTLADLLHGVYYDGGSAVAGVGRPQIQEPQASDTGVVPHTDAPTSSWIWVVGTPGGTNFGKNWNGLKDYGLFDPNTTALDGHMDAIKIDFGYRAETDASAGHATDHLVNGPLTGLVSGTHYPALDIYNNLPAVDAANSLTNGFYNPWIDGATASPGSEIVSWAPIRIQYTLGRYIGQSAYKFGLVSEDQYGRMNKGEKSIFPIFGTVFMFNSRYVWLGDTTKTLVTAAWDAAPRGTFTATGNTHTSALTTDQRYVFSYLPKGISNNGDLIPGPGTVGYNEWVDLDTNATYGANLFGRSDGAGAFASGVNTKAILPPAPASGNYYNASAGAWHTLDGLNTGVFELGPTWYEPYPANPLNEELNGPSHAAATVGTKAGASLTFVQFKGGTPDGTGGDPVKINVTVSGPYADNTVKAKIVPSNSPYDFFINNSNNWTSAAAIKHSNDGYNAPRFLNTPKQGDDSEFTQAMHHYYGQPQSEVNYAYIAPGREIWYSPATEWTETIGDSTTGTSGIGVGQIDVQAPRLRLSYTWPYIVTNTATGYLSAGAPNVFSEQDVMQIATPNLSGNARFFFTGNYPAGLVFSGVPIALPIQEQGDATDRNWFGKYGITGGISAPGDVTPTGVANAITPPFQPMHVVTNSIWIPNNADLHFNFPNSYNTPAGGSGYTDIPFVGIRGYLDGSLLPALNMNSTLAPNAVDVNHHSHQITWLTIGKGQKYNDVSPTGKKLDRNANPALLSTTLNDRIFAVWMKTSLAKNANAYGAWAGSQLIAGSSVVAKGAITTAPAFTMSHAPGALTDTQAQISFAVKDGQIGAANQTVTGSTGISPDGWKRLEFELLSNVMGAPAQFGLSRVVKPVHPTIFAGDTSLITNGLWDGNLRMDDGIVRDSLVVYGIRDRGTKPLPNDRTSYSNLLGQAGIEPGAPVLAQWWNTNPENTKPAGPLPWDMPTSDIALTSFPAVIQAFADEWLPSAEFTEVVEIRHNFVAKVVAPGLNAAGNVIQKLYLEQGVIAPRGHILLSQAGGIRPVVTPVRQLAINDLKSNQATGAVKVGTKLDIFNGNAVTPATGKMAVGAPDYKIFDGNSTADWTLNGYSNLQLTWQPAVNDQRHPSGYIATVYFVENNGGGQTIATPVAEYRMGHIGGVGALQTLNMPPLVSLTNGKVPKPQTTAFWAVSVRNVWIEGSEGKMGHSFDMGKEPWGTRFPMAWADCVSGVFVGRF